MLVGPLSPVAMLTVCTIVVMSQRLLEKVKLCEIRSEIYGASDHCPIVLEVEKSGDGL